MSSAKVNPVRQRGVKEATEALGLLETQKAFFGFWNVTVLCYGETAEEADQVARDVNQAISYAGFIPIRERLHLLSAFAGTLPGMWAELVRWYFISTENLADFSPSRSLDQGKVVNGARIYIFDKDYSCRIATLLMGGQHIDLNFETRTVRLNPLLLLADCQRHGRIKDWLVGLVTCRGYQMSEEDHRCLTEAVRGTFQMGPPMWRLRYLYPLLSPSPKLQAALAPWVHEGEFAHIYDNEEDSFSLSQFTCTEMGKILAVKEVARSFTDYVFLRIEIELAKVSERTENGEMVPRVPTLIYFEEGWYFLEDPIYRERFREYSKTLAKKLGILATSTQSLEDIADSPIFSSIRDNFPTKIFLPNRSAASPSLSRLYQDQFLLNSAQVEALASATPKKHYLICQGAATRLVSADFDPDTLACVRSDSEAQAVFEKHYRSGHAEWRTRYIEEICNA